MYVTYNISYLMLSNFKDESNLTGARSHEFCTPRTENFLQLMNLELRRGKKTKMLQ